MLQAQPVRAVLRNVQLWLTRAHTVHSSQVIPGEWHSRSLSTGCQLQLLPALPHPAGCCHSHDSGHWEHHMASIKLTPGPHSCCCVVHMPP